MRQRFKVAPPMNDEMALQITSMADIFTIILIFLLKSFATTSITPTMGLVLPDAEAQSPQIEALKLEISETSVLIAEQPIAPLKDFQFPKADLSANKASKSVSASLLHERQKQQLIAQANTNVKEDSRILIIADQKVPYSTLKTVLASAALSGYTDYKLVVLNK